MNCFINNIELMLQIGSEEFQEQLDRAWEKAQKKDHQMYAGNCGYADESLLSRGIGIAYYNSPKKKKIKLVVCCPSLVIDEDSSDELWVTPKNLSRLADKLDKLVVKYFHSDYGLDDFDLNRIDLSMDMDVGSRERVTDYIKVLHNIGHVKCFSPVKHDKDTGVMKDNCFGLVGNSNSIIFVVHELKHENKVLRAEVRLMSNSVIHNYIGEISASEQLEVIGEKGGDIFMDVFGYIVPRGDFYKKPKAEKLIREKVPDWKLRSRMLRLLALIPEKKSLHLAIKAMGCRNIKEVLAAFAEINVSPVTISKRHDIKMLPSFYSFISE